MNFILKTIKYSLILLNYMFTEHLRQSCLKSVLLKGTDWRKAVHEKNYILRKRNKTNRSDEENRRKCHVFAPVNPSNLQCVASDTTYDSFNTEGNIYDHSNIWQQVSPTTTTIFTMTSSIFDGKNCRLRNFQLLNLVFIRD